MVRTVFRLCAAALCLMVFPVEASSARIWSWSRWTMGISTPANPFPDPSSYIFGHVPAVGHPASEVATSQAILRTGDVVPAPVYADGTPAVEGELFWTASLWRAQFTSAPSTDWPPLIDGDRCDITFVGRMLTSTRTVVMGGWPTEDVQVLVTVVAVRSALPTSARQRTFGSVKAKYR